MKAAEELEQAKRAVQRAVRAHPGAANLDEVTRELLTAHRHLCEAARLLEQRRAA